ncbi:MAG: hypothetical protein U1F33_07270 [Alphaproteobacteria bacterium]
MDDAALARAVHVLAIVLWIGGVAMVTLVLLPGIRRLKSPAERIAFFEAIEGRFARQSRVTTLIAGASGLYLVHRLDLWGRFSDLSYWWMVAMVGVWLLFTIMLFVAEPLFLHRWFRIRAERAPESTFVLILRLHWVLFIASVLTIIGAVAGAHGLQIIG